MLTASGFHFCSTSVIASYMISNRRLKFSPRLGDDRPMFQRDKPTILCANDPVANNGIARVNSKNDHFLSPFAKRVSIIFALL